MQFDRENVDQAGKIYFKSSLEEIVGQQRTAAIKNILDIVDLVVEPDVADSKARKRIRKAVLDNINDLHRMSLNMITSIVGNNGVSRRSN